MRERRRESQGYVERLQERLNTSLYWRERFDIFGLDIDALMIGQFDFGKSDFAAQAGPLLK
jgi:hypothetical protein